MAQLELVHGIPVINTPNDMGRAFGDGGGIMRGGFDDDSYVPDMQAAPREMPTFDEAEQRARIEVQWKEQSGLIHQYLRSKVQHVDQDENGICWAASVTNGVQLVEMRDGKEPLAHLSCHALAFKITGFVDRGAWCGLAAKVAAEIGIPSVAMWPEKSNSRRYDTPATWAEAKGHAPLGMYYDMARREWDQVLTSRQINSQLLLNNPVPCDILALSHSMCFVGLGIHPAGDIMRCVMNSWRNWGYRGLGWLRGPWSEPRSAVALFQPSMSK